MRLLLVLVAYGLIYSALLARRGLRGGAPTGPAGPAPAPPADHALRVLVLGASGGTGREVVRQALARGHAVTAFVRDPARLPMAHANLRVVTGDALDPAAVDLAVAGQDAVVCALGHRVFLAPTRILSEATRHIVSAMERHGVRRFVVETALGLGDSAFRMGLWYTFIVLPLVLPFYFWDKTRQERAVAASGLDWTVVRPGALTDAAATGAYGIGPRVGGLVRTPAIARADVAAFLLDRATDRAHLREAVSIGGRGAS